MSGSVCLWNQLIRLSLQRIQEGHQTRYESMLLLQNTLEVAGAKGLEEQQQEVSGELVRAKKSELARDALGP